MWGMRVLGVTGEIEPRARPVEDCTVSSRVPIGSCLESPMASVNWPQGTFTAMGRSDLALRCLVCSHRSRCRVVLSAVCRMWGHGLQTAVGRCVCDVATSDQRDLSHRPAPQGSVWGNIACKHGHASDPLTCSTVLIWRSTRPPRDPVVALLVCRYI